MRMLRGLIALVLVCGLASVAKAQGTDFQMVVIDPTSGSNSWTTYDVTNPTFSFSFALCGIGQAPNDAYDGCYSGVNNTGQVLTSLTIVIPVFDYPAGTPQSPGCAPSGSGLDLFVQCTPGTDETSYTLDFTGGNGIAVGQYFTFAEVGVPVADFPTDVSAAFGVPESRSMALLGVDVVMCVGFIAFWRRRVVRVSHF